MDTGADAMPVSDRLRLRWPSPEAASGVEDPWASEDDVALVGRVTVGDAAALTALYRRHADRLFAFLQQYARDRMVAEELLQDTLLAVWRSAPLYAGRSSVRTWMFGIARRQAHNWLRIQEPQKLPLDGLVGWADPAPGPAEWAIARAQRSPTHSPRSPHTTVRCWRWRRGPVAAQGDRGGPGCAGGDGEEPAAPRPRSTSPRVGRPRVCGGDAMSGDGLRHPTDALAEYAAGVLDPPERTTVETHLTACSSCRTAVLGWTAVAAATETPMAAPPSARR